MKSQRKKLNPEVGMTEEVTEEVIEVDFLEDLGLLEVETENLEALALVEAEVEIEEVLSVPIVQVVVKEVLVLEEEDQDFQVRIIKTINQPVFIYGN